MKQIVAMYKYNLDEIVETKVDLISENKTVIPAGSKIRLVAFAPKVRLIKDSDKSYCDKKSYFYNAVLATQENDYSDRIRADFVTIKKIK